MINKKTEENNNILLVANFKSDVGYAWWLMENFWAEIALKFQNTKNCILIYPKVGTIPDIIKNAPIDIIEHDFSDKSLSSVIKLLKIIRQNEVGFVYLTDRVYFDWRYFLMKLAGVRVIVNHDHMPGEREKPPAYKRYIKKFIHFIQVFSCDHYIGVSRFVKNRAVNVACIPKDKCSYVYNGIRIFDNLKSTYANDNFNIPKGSKIIVTSGRATFYKGIDKLIKCSHRLINEKGIKDLYFLHLGGGPDLEKFKEMAVELGVDKKFIFAGFRSDIYKILPSCDIGIQVSLGEAFSLSIIEYMCAGLATIAPNNCGNPEAVEDGVNGVLFAPGDISDLVEKITYLLNNDEFTQNIKENARKSVVEKFTIENCNKKLLSLLERQFV